MARLPRARRRCCSSLRSTPASFASRFCCLLSDGTIASGIQGSKGVTLTLLNGWSGTTLLPRNRYFVTGEALTNPTVHFDPPAEFPLAFNAMDSDTAPITPSIAPGHDSNGQNVFVRAVVVGIAVLDPEVQKLLSASQLQALTGSAVLAKADGQTPIDAWDITSTTSVTATTNRTNLGPNGPQQIPLGGAAEHPLLPKVLLCQLRAVSVPFGLHAAIPVSPWSSRLPCWCWWRLRWWLSWRAARATSKSRRVVPAE